MSGAGTFNFDFGSPHGTDSKYRRSGCRCTSCRAAHAEASRLRVAARKADADTGWVPVPHGKESTYKNYGCRCDECRAAVNAAQRARRARRSA